MDWNSRCTNWSTPAWTPREFGFGEAEPAVGVEVAGFLEAVLEQVEDDQSTAGVEDPEGFGERAGRLL